MSKATVNVATIVALTGWLFVCVLAAREQIAGVPAADAVVWPVFEKLIFGVAAAWLSVARAGNKKEAES